MIQFTGEYTIDSETFGVHFQAKMNGENIVCKVSVEALQDIDPQNAQDVPEQQFIAHRSSFEAIAKRKIENREIKNGTITIRTTDIFK